MTIQEFLEDVVKAVEWIENETAKLFADALIVISKCGPSGVKLGTEIAAQVASGTITPMQATQDLTDAAAFQAGVVAAAQAIAENHKSTVQDVAGALNAP